MKTFKQFLEEANKNTYGWLNPKGSFIRNRNGDVHGDTYSKFTGDGKPSGDGYGYHDKIDRALGKGWQRLDVYSDHERKVVDGMIQGKAKSWTPRHAKAMERVKKALGAKGYKSEIEKF